MKTLVIHPEDETTDFLEIVYNDIENVTVIREDVPDAEIRRQIELHERIIMLGHGAYVGLLGHYKLVIDKSHAELLRKKDCIGVWCHANEYFDMNKINGFCTSMFISESIEARIYSMTYTDDEIDLNNRYFAKCLRNSVSLTTPEILEYLKANFILDSEIARFNHSGLAYFDSQSGRPLSEGREEPEVMRLSREILSGNNVEAISELAGQFNDDKYSQLIQNFFKVCR